MCWERRLPRGLMFGHRGWFVSPFSVCMTLCGGVLASKPSRPQGHCGPPFSLVPAWPQAPVSGAHSPWVVCVLCRRQDCSCCMDENGEAQGSLTWGCSPGWNPGSPTLAPSAPYPSLGCTTRGYEPAEVHVALLLLFWHHRTCAPASSAGAQSDGASARQELPVES